MGLPHSQNYLTDNEDLLWHLNNTVDWAALLALSEPDLSDPEAPDSVEEAKETYMTMLEEIGRAACSARTWSTSPSAR
jgi:hypothetical protein